MRRATRNLRSCQRGCGRWEMRELAVRSTRLAVVPGWVGELTRLEALEVSGVDYEERNAVLKSLPASLGQLGALKQLTLAWLDGLEVLPDAVVRLTSLGSLTIEWCGSLPCLQQLQVLGLRASGFVALQAGDVLAIGRALKAWPLPLLNDVEGILRLSTCWQALGLPAAAANEDWTNAMTLDYFRVQQQKVAALASGMHSRLGAA